MRVTKSILLSALVLASELSAGCMTGGEPDPSADELSSITSDVSTDRMHSVQIKSAINPAGTGKCMDVAGGYTSPGTPIVQYACHQPAGANQAFHLVLATVGLSTGATYQIVSNLDQTMCVGINIPSNRYYAVNNDLLVLKRCLDSTGNPVLDTKWIPVNDRTFSSTPSITALESAAPSSPAALCIDVASGLDWDSLWLQTYQCHGGPNQQWVITNL